MSFEWCVKEAYVLLCKAKLPSRLNELLRENREGNEHELMLACVILGGPFSCVNASAPSSPYETNFAATCQLLLAKQSMDLLYEAEAALHPLTSPLQRFQMGLLAITFSALFTNFYLLFPSPVHYLYMRSPVLNPVQISGNENSYQKGGGLLKGKQYLIAVLINMMVKARLEVLGRSFWFLW
ncbi:unnamed protein product [Fraxinus pennsylvanica]|uniref:Uncharacterized protein n=1 Tax=Fraxinus pennsylvanica TaxID=56036 RepID=A0AAD2A817_9LAMI|nr:unnamed protein product [Fraxinus pennsylvanica]